MNIKINIKMNIIVITGASSGLGKNIAIEYSKREYTHLFLFGRNKEALDKVGNACQKNGATISIKVADVRNRSLMQEKIHEILKLNGKIDILIANAGVSESTVSRSLSQNEKDEEITDINVCGLINTVVPALSKMVEQKCGVIAIIGSMAGISMISNSPVYCASKGFAIKFAEILRAKYLKSNIAVIPVIPGYIDTRMTKNNKFFMPFKISAEIAAERIVKGIDRKKRIIYIPFIMYLIVIVSNLLPRKILDLINYNLLKNKSDQND